MEIEYDEIEIVSEKKKEKGTIKIPVGRLIKFEGERQIRDNPYVGIPMDASEELDGKAIYLDPYYDWVLGRTSGRSLVCIPLKKEVKG